MIACYTYTHKPKFHLACHDMTRHAPPSTCILAQESHDVLCRACQTAVLIIFPLNRQTITITLDVVKWREADQQWWWRCHVNNVQLRKAWLVVSTRIGDHSQQVMVPSRYLPRPTQPGHPSVGMCNEDRWWFWLYNVWEETASSV